jgi:2,3-bisphosphoglycerate-dependent phosphoglycerate mutase
MPLLYLVRHAHAEWSPDEDRPLSPRGQADAQAVADLLARHAIDAIYASPAARARQTIEPLAARLDLPIQTERDLRERELGDAPVADFQAAVRATWDDPAFHHPGGESNLAAQQRGVAVVERLAARHPHAPVVVATHGNLLALILQQYDAVAGFAFWQALSMPDIYRLETSASGANWSRVWA